MGLSAYARKRDFSRTPEPKGRRRSTDTDAPIFVVQKHAASHLHYDFRLEHDGVLWSWAVPKGPSLDPADKRLAIHVEDHPVEYATFEGIIPKGEYGGGTVMLWDRGTWDPPEHPARDLKQGKLTFTLHGERLRGAWTLTRLRTKNGDSDERDQWLLIKGDDDDAARNGKAKRRDADDTSVATGRTMDEIAERAKKPGGRVWRSNRAQGTEGAGTPAPKVDPSELQRAKKARIPGAFSPQLCTLSDKAPVGEGWIHEIKFDGYRLVSFIDRGRVAIRTRTGKDWTHKFQPLAEALKALPVRAAVLDGEATIVDAKGRTSFQRLQNSIKHGDFGDLVYFLFDLVHLDGYDLTACTLLERKQALRALLPADDATILRYSDHIEGHGGEVEQRACRLGLEGVICKRADAVYEQRRSATWLKVKCTKRQEFVVIGWSPPSGSRKHFGSLLLGAHDADGLLRYTGRVGTGFTEDSLRDIGARLNKIERATCPADVPPERSEQAGVRWVKPALVAEVEFTEWTGDGRLRHPSFQGLREDMSPDAVRIERPEAVEELDDMPRETRATRKKPASSRKPASTNGRAARTASRPARRDDEAEVAGVRISNPDRVLYAEQGITKLDLARYYEAVADRILPFLVGRPLSTVRCPRGSEGECFFQKHLGETIGDPVRAIRVKEKDGELADYIAVDTVQGLITLIQFGVLEFHPWGSTEDHLESPDMLTFDLDPGPGVGFDRVKASAIEVRDALESVGLNGFLKASGGKGLHVVVPVTLDSDWETAKRFCEAFAKAMASQDKKRYVAVASKAQRNNRIFIDYLRNSRGATSIAPYSTRSRPGAPVAVPLRWDELSRLTSASQYDITSVRRRLGTMRSDPWKTFAKDARPIPSTGG